MWTNNYIMMGVTPWKGQRSKVIEHLALWSIPWVLSDINVINQILGDLISTQRFIWGYLQKCHLDTLFIRTEIKFMLNASSLISGIKDRKATHFKPTCFAHSCYIGWYIPKGHQVVKDMINVVTGIEHIAFIFPYIALPWQGHLSLLTNPQTKIPWK